MKDLIRVLIIEDELPMIDTLDFKLSREGYAVTRARDGVEGLMILGKESFDCILLDIIMPKADGFAVLEELKKRGITTPVFVLTNLSQDEDERRVKELGAKKYIVKTAISIQSIAKEVRKVIKG